MAQQKVSATIRRKAKDLNERGLQHYNRWEVDDALKCFEQAVKLSPDESEYHINLARAQARFGDYDQALKALGEFIRTEPDRRLVERFEMLFANVMDEVETLLTDKMMKMEVPIEEIGAAIQMWLEFRIAVGRRPLSIRRPETWAGAIDYTVRKVNFREATQKELAALYNTTEASIRSHHLDLIETLDIMPCDYRYFRGKENPLDKLVEAAAMLEELEERFRETV
jgi:tetratricopeptide (TPR) repeat protein